jgi:hypothetical protein
VVVFNGGTGFMRPQYSDIPDDSSDCGKRSPGFTEYAVKDILRIKPEKIE